MQSLKRNHHNYMGKEDINGQELAAEEHVDIVAEEEDVSRHAQDIERLTQELERTRDQLLRRAAELQNFRRRTEREKAEWHRRAQVQVIDSMVGVFDDFQRSLDAAEQSDVSYESLKEGVDLVYRSFAEALKRFGVEALEAVGKPFDENLHEAVLQMPAPEGTEAGVVLQEIQKGYRIGDSVLRHAKVIVAAMPPEAPS